ncbi:hypothetical protein [Thermocrinis sp.]
MLSNGVKQTSQARVRGWVLSKGKGLSYNQKLSTLVLWAGAVRVYLTSKL